MYQQISGRIQDVWQDIEFDITSGPSVLYKVYIMLCPGGGRHRKPSDDCLWRGGSAQLPAQPGNHGTFQVLEAPTDYI